MALLNYTTQIATEKTVSEIQTILARAGANAIMTQFNDKQVLNGISFRIQTPHGPIAYALPCDISAVLRILAQQSHKGKVPRRLVTEDQAARVGWRIIKDWVEAQMALIETQMVSLDQVFLPYAQTRGGETVYQRYLSGGMNLLLTGGES